VDKRDIRTTFADIEAGSGRLSIIKSRILRGGVFLMIGQIADKTGILRTLKDIEWFPLYQRLEEPPGRDIGAKIRRMDAHRAAVSDRWQVLRRDPATDRLYRRVEDLGDLIQR
jgi:hypothetical protein